MTLDEILILAFTGVVATSTAVYAFLTWKLVSETRRMREVQTEPRVSVRAEMDHTGLYGYELTVSNEGKGVAKNVRFEFAGDPTYFHREFRGVIPTVDQWPVIKDGIDSLEAGQIFRYPLGTVSVEGYKRAIENPWIIHVLYENQYGESRNTLHTVDFSKFRGTVFERNMLREIADQLEAIRKEISRLTEGK